MSDNILQKLKAGVHNKKMIKWPGSGADVLIRVLSEQDHLEATLAADQIFRTKGSRIDRENIEAYESEKNNQLLFRAVLDPETEKPVAPSMAEFRPLLARGVREALLDEVDVFQDECSPSPSNMEAEEFDSLFQRVKKNAEKTVTNVSSILLLRRLIITLAAELTASQTDNGST